MISDELKKRFDDEIKTHPVVIYMKGNALFPRCGFSAAAYQLLSAHGRTSRAFARRLLEDHGVAAIDGAAFGARGEGRLRFSFASAQADLDAALARIGEAVGSLQ